MAGGKGIEAAAIITAGRTARDSWQDEWKAFNIDVKNNSRPGQVEETRLEHMKAHQGVSSGNCSRWRARESIP